MSEFRPLIFQKEEMYSCTMIALSEDPLFYPMKEGRMGFTQFSKIFITILQVLLDRPMGLHLLGVKWLGHFGMMHKRVVLFRKGMWDL